MNEIRESITERLNGLHEYGLARRAELFDPNGDDSPGAVWLRNVRDSAVEQFDYIEDDELTPDGIRAAFERDWTHESADALVPVYTHDRWEVFTDLGAWQVDVSDFGPLEDMTQAAGLALYESARTLLASLGEEAAEVAATFEEDTVSSS